MTYAGDMPTYADLMLPVLEVVADLGGSAQGSEIVDALIERGEYSVELLQRTYPDSDKVMLVDRMRWARSYLKIGGALESPRRGLFVLSDLGRDILALDPQQPALERLRELDRQVRSRRKAGPRQQGSAAAELDPDLDKLDELREDDWRDAFLGRLHGLTPLAFEEFTLYLLRLFGLQLTHQGGTGDEGIDGIGIAPLSPVLSSVVAVQAKRYDPSTAISREQVALFQRDAAAKGAERAIFVTLGRFSSSAKKAATTSTPTVDLIDGQRLCDLALENLEIGREIGLRRVVEVNGEWFERFGR
ncbi:restriction endonuclease [Ferrimicrobium sp.]|uniref:restriction endonuclease n=1 Tax=Ferrimicrobium sp. TaxID=2926050 RepID=UPI002620FB72|nr:restriction endonuclease [Ferrimicrobium sp.]